jgi:flagellar basal-body rod protein FlgB
MNYEIHDTYCLSDEYCLAMSVFDSTTIPVLQEVVSFAQARHEILVGNVANMDTPGYQVRDLSVETFQDRLREAIEAQDDANGTISPGEVSGNYDAAMRRVREASQGILYHDGSNVDIEKQVLEVSKNQYMHNMAISIMASQFELLRVAVSERV